MAGDGFQTLIIWMIKHWLFTTRLYSWALSTYSCWPTVDYSQQKAQLFHWQPIWAPSIKSNPVDQNRLSSWVFCAKWRMGRRAKNAVLRNAVQCAITFWSVKETSRKIDGTGFCRQRQFLLHWCHMEKLDYHTITSPINTDYECRIESNLPLD